MRRLLPRRVASGLLLFIIIIALISGLFLSPGAVKPAKAGCGWGDIICDMKAALEQLIDNYVTPMQWWAYLQFHKLLFNIEYRAAELFATVLWGISRMLTTVGVGIGILSQWIAQNFFQPMIEMTSDTMRPIVGVFLFAALGILGITYFLAAFIRLNVVSLRSVIVWWIAGALFFSVGPSIYLSMRNLHQGLTSVFYASSLDAIDENPFQNLAANDPAAASPVYQMTSLCSNFTAYVDGSAGNINGMDVSLAFQKADGLDVVNGGDSCLGAGTSSPLPRRWYLTDGFFETLKGPDSWIGAVVCPTGDPTPECEYEELANIEIAKMQESVNRAFAGIAREFQSAPLVLFAIVEQLVALCLVIAQGLTFISFACAILFAFFKRTEPVAWAVVDQWLALLVQSVIIALIQGMTIALYIAASESGSPLVSMAVSVVAFVMMAILLLSGLKAIWGAFNKLFEAFGQASGGVFMSPGQAGTAVVGAAATVGMAAATGGASLAGSVAGGVDALRGGATWAQAAGVTFGGSKALDGAATQLARIPGLRDTTLGSAFEQYSEGAMARQAGESVMNAVPGVGGALKRLGGASLGASFLSDRNPDNAEAVLDQKGEITWKQPLLNKSVGSALGGMLTSPKWDDDQTSAPGQNPQALTKSDGSPVRHSDFYRENDLAPAMSGATSQFMPVINNGEGSADEIARNDMQQQLRIDRQSGGSGGDGQQLAGSASQLENSAKELKSGADQLKQSAQQARTSQNLEAVEGRMNVSGSGNVAALLARTIDNLHQENRETGQQGATTERVSKAMAGSMGMTPIQHNGQEVSPIEGRTNLYQMFTDQALRSGVSGNDAAQVLREVKASPNGSMSPATRNRLIQEQREEHGQSWNDSIQNVQALESTARLVPSAVTAYGTRPMPAETSREPVVLSPAASNGHGAVTFTRTTNPVTPRPAASAMPQQSAALHVMNAETSSNSRPVAEDNSVNDSPPESPTTHKTMAQHYGDNVQGKGNYD